GLKLFRRQLLERLFDCMLVRRYAFDAELAVLAVHNGFSVEEEPVTVNFLGRQGSMSLSNVFNMTVDVLAIFYRLKILGYYDSWVPKRNKETPFISVVIAVKKDNDYLRQSIRHSLNQDYPKDSYEIIVLPDEGFESPDPMVRIIPSGPELPAIKRNMGAKAARGSIIAFLDDDAYPAENWLAEMAGNFHDERLAGVGGPGTTPRDDSFWQKVGGSVYESKMMSGGYSYRYLVDRRRMVDDYPTCNLALRKDVFLEAGGFQTNFWPGEDTELCLTVTKKLGYNIVYDPMVEVCHHRRHLFKGHFRQLTQYALHRGYFVKKFPETSRKLSYFLPTVFLFGVLLGPLTFFIKPLAPLGVVYIAALVFYFVLSFFCAIINHPKLTIFTVFGVFLSHLAYGWYFLVGLLSSKLSKEEEYHASLRRKHEA
ncbi:glycosyltransferase, partial [bacterium]|nr:glycosyltransferase [bacterium]